MTRSPAPASVAPFAGAWIETALTGRPAFFAASPPSRGRGSKLVRLHHLGISVRRPLRGGVDRNSSKAPAPRGPRCRPLRGGVDRNAHYRQTY